MAVSKKVQKLMRMPLAKEIIKRIAGDDGWTVYKFLLKSGRKVDEFKIEERTKLQINYVRSLLYKLYEQMLVIYSRRRDRVKGWFIYSWQALPRKLKELMIKELRQREERINWIIENAKFYCRKCDKYFTYEEAVESFFYCPRCGKRLVEVGPEKLRRKFEGELRSIKKKLKELEKLKL